MATVTTALQSWEQLRIGAGGYLTSYDQHQDGTLVARTDTFGAYLRNTTTNLWEQLVNATSLPSEDNARNIRGGCFEIAIAPSNSQIFYMVWMGWLYRSLNRGTTWTKTAMPRMTNNYDGQYGSNAGAQRLYGQKIAIDPLNVDVVYVGSMDDGLWRTLDGGVTGSVITDVPVGTGSAGAADPGVLGIIFDPLSGSVSGRTAILWASSYGNGYYRSEDGGSTFTKPTGGPSSSVRYATYSVDGDVLWAVETGGDHLWRWQSGAWGEITASITAQDAHCVLCDPFDNDRIIVCTTGGRLQESVNANDATPTFTDITVAANATRTATDVPWLSPGDSYMAVGRMQFHPTIQNKIMLSNGVGFWSATVAPGILIGTVVAWISMSAGVEQLITNQILATPASTLYPNGNLIVCHWDRSLFKSVSPRTYPDHYSLSQTVNHCFGADYCATNPDEIVAVSSGISGYSTDGGDTFTQFAAYPAAWSNVQRGEVACCAPGKYLWVPGYAKQPYYTTDYGATWNAISISGIDDDSASDGLGWWGYNWGNNLKRHICAADRVTANKYYLYHYIHGLYVSTDAGANWSQAFAGTLLATQNSYHAKLRSPEGQAGHLWFTAGEVGGVPGETPVGNFIWSENGGVDWSTVADVKEVIDFGFGATAPGGTYPRIWLHGWVNGTAESNLGIFYSDDKCVSFVKVADRPNQHVDNIVVVEGDKVKLGMAYVGFQGSGSAFTQGSIPGKPLGLQF